MRTHILQAAMFAALLACAVGIAAFARGAYYHASHQSVLDRSAKPAAQLP